MEMERDPERPSSLARIDLRSRDFGSGSRMADRPTPDGGDISPALEWTQVPGNTQTFAVICEDLDAPGSEPFVHWLIYDIPGSRNILPEGIRPDELPPDLAGAAQGLNDFGKIGYVGPAPPVEDGAHRYVFRIFALDRILRLQAGATKRNLFDAMKGHAIGYGEVMATCGR